MTGHRGLEDRISEVRRELVLRAACGGPDHLEREEELLDELADLERCAPADPYPGRPYPAGEKFIRETNS
ncbi:MAG: hypothetical protein WA990_02875 [Rubrobacteraceae bacterium]